MSYNSWDFLYTPPPPDFFYFSRSPPYYSPDYTPVSYSTNSGGSSSSVNIVVSLIVVVVVVAAISLGAYLFIKKRKKRRNASYNDFESPKQHQGVIKLQTSPENAPSYHNIHPMSSPAPLLQQTQTSSPAPYHSFYDTGASGSSYNSGISDYQQQPPLSSNLKISMSSKNTFTYEELLTATNGFSMNNLLGRGGFGSVFKGFINGREVAVKKMKAGNGQGDREFQAEVETISRVHHRHLVSLVGYCITEDQRLLVYEFVPNQNLEQHLHDKRLPPMEWSKRLKIALGSAKGLTYLHEECYPTTIHRDIKAANILLDLNFEPKVADFGLAKQSNENVTHVSTRIMGTFGYLAPEYASSGKLTVKSDVFSFGVVLLELITGRTPVDNSPRYVDDTASLVDWAKPVVKRSLEENNYDEIVDPRLQHLGYNKDEMRRMVACAAACVRHSARQRPRISLVVKVLEGDVSIDELHDGVKPGQSTIYSSHYGKTQYYNDMEKHRKLALSSEEFSSTEHTQSEFSISSISAEQRGR